MKILPKVLSIYKNYKGSILIIAGLARTQWGLLVALCWLCLLPACAATVTPSPPVFLTLAGSTSMAPLLADLTAAYSAQQPHYSFDIQTGGSALGQRLVEGGQVDIGLVSWPPTSLAANTRLVPIARDALAIILHPQNPQTNLSLAELQGIFSGRQLDWPAPDGSPRPIQVVSREAGSGDRAAFETMVMADQAVTPTAIVLPNSQAVIDFVAQNPTAIGYVSFNFITEEVSAASIDNVPPTLDSLTANHYPLSRELALIIPDPARPEVDSFVQFILSPTGQAIVAKRWGAAP